MRGSYNRRTATKVKGGKVQRKNRHTPTGHMGYVLDRESPGHGFRHVLNKRDVQAFIDIIPDWPKFGERLERIVLAAPTKENLDACYYFYHREETGAIYLHAWADDLWVEFAEGYFESHKEILDSLGLSYNCLPGRVQCRFTEDQARAFMLLHIFLHELGHHYDRLTSKHRSSDRGEDYAERFANSRFKVLLPKYIEVFGDPSRGTPGR